MIDDCRCNKCDQCARELEAARTRIASLERDLARCNLSHDDLSVECQKLRAQGLSQEDRDALDAGSTALQERGEFHVYKDGKIYTRHECNEMASRLRRLGGQTT